MTQAATLDAYATHSEPATLTIQRLLPGPIERIWAFLTESELRRQWLASGDMEMKVGAPFKLTWRNGELNCTPGPRPAGASEEHSMESRITELDPPRKLAFAWGSTGGVAITLEPKGSKVLLTLVHSNIPERAIMLKIGAGWHMHLDVLAAITSGTRTGPFWDGWSRLHEEYGDRIPA